MEAVKKLDQLYDPEFVDCISADSKDVRRTFYSSLYDELLAIHRSEKAAYKEFPYMIKDKSEASQRKKRSYQAELADLELLIFEVHLILLNLEPEETLEKDRNLGYYFLN